MLSCGESGGGYFEPARGVAGYGRRVLQDGLGAIGGSAGFPGLVVGTRDGRGGPAEGDRDRAQRGQKN